MAAHRTKRGFSLVELVIVIVIIGVIAAIAVPRISRGASGAGAAGLRADLYVLRNAIDLYSAEHVGAYPTVAAFVAQMTTYTDDIGGTSPTKTGAYIYGPYIQAIPKLKVGAGANNGKGKNVVAAGPAASTTGWLYVEATGLITANSGTATDDAGDLYTTY
jgi:general secretion pathway protein G